MKKELKPRKVKILSGDEAWCYVNNGSIDVFVALKGHPTLSARLTKRQLISILSN